MGKLRMGLDLIIPPLRGDEDESLAAFIRRRLGSEALDKLAAPLMSGIYNAEPEKQSILATFPQFRAIEKAHGGLIRGLRAVSRQRAAQPESEADKTPLFMSLRGGVNELIDALVSQLSGDLCLNTPVTAIQRTDGNGYHVFLQDGSRLEAEVVIITTPANVTAKLVREIAPRAAELLIGVRYVSAGTISLAFRDSDIPNRLDGFGLVIPARENRSINALTIASTKFDHRAPQGYTLMRAYFGGSRRPEMMYLDDDRLLQTVRADLQAILDIHAEPLFYRVYRWRNASPQYDVGHLARVDAIESALPRGLYITGSAYRGVGVPDCVRQSQQTAERIVAEYMERVVD